MSTPRRFFQKDSFYHIYNRGNRKSQIFLDKRDYLRFLEKTKIYKDRYEVDVLCYCLMPNHFHLLVKQKSETPLTKFMLALATSYSKYFNLRHGEVGRLFQERFQAKLVETDEYLLQLSRYIHLNPSEIGKRLEDYAWSSFKFYVDSSIENNFVNPELVLSYFGSNLKPKTATESYKEFVLAGKEEEMSEALKDLMVDL